jgi:dTDP-4-amino-4,6-dideoxygalactose transaminase
MVKMISAKSEISSQTWPTWPHFSLDETNAVMNVLQSGKVNYWTGEQGRLFEQEFAMLIGTKYAICLMNGTVAIEAALYALDIGVGDEVITTPRTFIASASAIIMRGATPIFADVDDNSQNITAESIAKVITKKTKAIIAVHLGGWPCDMEAILALANHHGIHVIEDCAQAHGAQIHQRYAGSFGIASAFSFCQDKILTTGGEGGMVTTNDESVFKKIWAFKDHGKGYDIVHQPHTQAGFRWLHETFGTNWRMTEIQAAIGRIQLTKLGEWVKVRQRNAAILNEKLRQLSAVHLPLPPPHINHAYYKYYIFIRQEKLKSGWNRDKIMSALLEKQVPCFVGSCSEIYNERAFTHSKLQANLPLPTAKKLGENSLMFLVHPTLTEEKMIVMGELIEQVINEASIN